ncbi:MAG: hypothetical protein FWD60_03450 [Candidatus Azobacteroides sp.]|nr:hypothetical protein [Candidatus Azobacteroides sp.]
MNKKVIILVAAIAVAVAVGIVMWITSLDKAKPIALPTNQFTAKIEAEIEQLKAKPDNKFCKDFYNVVAFHISDFYKQNRFGKNQSENDQWKENLEKNLYSAYAEKFIKQVRIIFRGSEWKPEDLNFIQAEKNELKKSKLLVAGSPVDKEFTTIQTALNKYNEIVSFISSCKSFGFSGTALSDRFPIENVREKLSKVASLRNNRLENEFVNNCTRLHDGLKEIPQALFKKHVWYLDNKIDYWSNMWCNYNSHKDYSQNLNTPLKNEINDLGNSTIYSGVNVDNQYNYLLQKWSRDNQKAYNATYPCK